MSDQFIYTPEGESMLLRLVANGSKEAYAALYKHYLPKLFIYLNGMLQSKEESEEILQDIFLKIWERKEEVLKIKSLNSYLFSMAKNKLLNLHDHQKVKQKAIGYLSHQAPVVDNAADGQYIYAQHLSIVEKAIEVLPPKRKQIFQMSTQLNMSQDEIAAELKISKSMVKKQLYAATRHVKEYLQVYAGINGVLVICMTELYGQHMPELAPLKDFLFS